MFHLQRWRTSSILLDHVFCLSSVSPFEPKFEHLVLQETAWVYPWCEHPIEKRKSRIEFFDSKKRWTQSAMYSKVPCFEYKTTQPILNLAIFPSNTISRDYSVQWHNCFYYSTTSIIDMSPTVVFFRLKPFTRFLRSEQLKNVKFSWLILNFE